MGKYAYCPVESVPGIVGYQASNNLAQIDMVRYPMINVESTLFWNVEPKDTITFVCKDPTQMLRFDGNALGLDESANMYTYRCLEEIQASDEFTSKKIPLSCVARPDDMAGT